MTQLIVSGVLAIILVQAFGTALGYWLGRWALLYFMGV